MKKILCIFCVAILLSLSVLPSFATYSASVEVVNNDTDSSEVSVQVHSVNYCSNDFVTGGLFWETGENYDSSTDRMRTGFFDLMPDTLYFTSTYNTSFAFFFYDVNKSFISYMYYPYNSTFRSPSNCYFCRVVYFGGGSDPYLLCISNLNSVTHSYTYFNNTLPLSSFVATQSELYTPLSFIRFKNNGTNNVAIYAKAYSDSELTVDFTSSVASSSGLELTNDSILLEFDSDGYTPSLYYDGTVYYVVTLYPSGGYVYTNLYRHIIFEYGLGFVHFFDNCKPLFIIIVGSTATVAFLYVIYLFIKKHKE